VYLRRAPRIIFAISWLLGVLTLVGAFWARERDRVHTITRIVPVPATAAVSAVLAVSGLLLLRVAAGLRKGKKRAWQMAVGLATLMTVAHLFGDDRRLGEAAISVVLLVLLVAARSRFTAKPDPRSRWVAAVVLVQFLLVAFAYGLALPWFYPGQVVGHPSFAARVQEVADGLVGATGPIRLTGDRFSDIYYGTLFGFGLVTLIAVVLLGLRPFEPVTVLSTSDERRLRDLLDKQGERDSLGYFALRRDKSVLWSPTGKAAIAYRVVHGVVLASGDPVGDPEAWPGAMHEYLRLAREFGWTPAVIGCSELGALVYRRECGLTALALGDEAIVECAEFSLDGRPMRGVRQACTRVRRAGYDVQVRRLHEIGADEIDELVQMAAAWRGDAVERGFSMALSRLGDPSDPQCVIATARQSGVLRGLLHFVPWGADGLSLDLMRRDREADNGLNEFLITEVIDAGPSLGVRRISLNFAVFRDALERGEKIGAGPVLRMWRGVILFLSRWWQIESLYRFNVKFRPYWEPRFLSFPAARDVPRIAVAAMEAEAFLVRPHRPQETAR
jgi:lysyl-tRNA synthetase class 2